jgi:ABC-type glycerol-3-phosphate transport system permease component
VFQFRDASRVDGANSWKTLSRILLPVSLPVVTTLMVLITCGAGTSSSSPLLAASALIVALPVVLLYVGMQRYIIRGLTQGAIKG